MFLVIIFLVSFFLVKKYFIYNCVILNFYSFQIFNNVNDKKFKIWINVSHVLSQFEFCVSVCFADIVCRELNLYYFK